MTADELLTQMSADIRTNYLAHVVEATVLICTEQATVENQQHVEDHLDSAQRLIYLVRQLTPGGEHDLPVEWEDYFGPVTGDTARQLIDAVEEVFAEIPE